MGKVDGKSLRDQAFVSFRFSRRAGESLASVTGLREKPNSEGHGCERINSQHTIRKWEGYYEKRIRL